MTEEKKSILSGIASLKKDLLIMRLKLSMRESVILKDYRNKKKEIARLFTKLNSK
jgi:ribosomal protein L29